MTITIPEYCYTLNNITIDPKTGVGKIIKVKAFEEGYYPTSLDGDQAEVNALNKKIGVTRAEEEAMSYSSMFGWQIYKNMLEKFQKIYKEDE